MAIVEGDSGLEKDRYCGKYAGENKGSSWFQNMRKENKNKNAKKKRTASVCSGSRS